MTSIESDGFLSTEAIDGCLIIRERFADIFLVAEDMNRVALSKLSTARLSEIHEGSLVLYLLSIRVIESYEAIMILMERGMLAPAKLIVRPMLEAFFTLGALEKNKELVAKYFGTQSKVDFELLRSSTQWRNQDLKMYFKEAGLEAKYIQKKRELKNNPPESMRPIEWAKAADYEDFYHYYYVHYASFTHSNLSSLDDHIDKTREEGKVEASFGPTISGFYSLASDAIYFLLLSVIHMCSAFNIEVDADSARIRESLHRLHASHRESQ